MDVTKVVGNALKVFYDNDFEEEDIISSEKDGLGYLDVLVMGSECIEIHWRIYVKSSEIVSTRTAFFNGAEDLELFETFRNEDTFLKFLKEHI